MLSEIIKTTCRFFVLSYFQLILKFIFQDNFKSVLDDIRKLLINLSKTAISLPDLYEGQDLSKQWLELLVDSQGKLNFWKFE